MPRRSMRPSHRRTDEYQPIVDQLTGILVPASRVVVSDVEGLRGLAIGDTFPFERQARVRPGYEDLRGISPGVVQHELIPVQGGELGPYQEEEWLPTDLADLEMWYDQDALALVGDGNAISSWTDLSGNGKHLLQATPSWRPTVRQVGTDSVLDPIWEVQCDAANKHLVTASFVDFGSPVVVGVVWRLMTALASGENRRVNSSTGAEQLVLRAHGPGGVYNVQADHFSQTDNAGNGVVPLSGVDKIGVATHYTVAVWSGVNSRLRFDGAELSYSVAPTGVPAATDFALGYPNHLITYRAAVVTSSIPDAEDMLLLESYLRYRARS